MAERKKIIINSEKLETRLALLWNDSLEEYYVERKNNINLVGSVFLGKVINIQPSLEAVFVDIGTDKNAFMHFNDMLPATFDEANLKKRKKAKKKIQKEDIPNIFPVGSTLFVQVTKGPIGTKGPRCTTNISIPGKYLVFLPFSDHLGISTKIEDRDERDRLKKLMLELPVPQGHGLIARTASEKSDGKLLLKEFELLHKKWLQADSYRKDSNKPSIVFAESSLIERCARDILNESIDEIIVDDEHDFEVVKDLTFALFGKKFVKRISLYRKAEPIFEHYAIENKIANIFERKVFLPSGGYICIDETEALVAIDVNSGASKGIKGNNDLILNTNLEAADEIARQLKLRNIGGIIVVDFIDMETQFARDRVLKRVKQHLKADKAKSNILPISSFGLMQMTRQRDQQSLINKVYDPCPYCEGIGKIKSAFSLSIEIQRELKEILKRKNNNRDLSVRVVMNPTVLARLKNEDDLLFKELESKYGKDLSFRADPTLHVEEFKIIDTVTGEDLN